MSLEVKEEVGSVFTFLNVIDRGNRGDVQGQDGVGAFDGDSHGGLVML